MKYAIFIFFELFLLIFFYRPSFSQYNRNKLNLNERAKEIFSWDVEKKPNGFIMFSEIPYAIDRSFNNYMSITVANKGDYIRPSFISFTLPQGVKIEEGIALRFFDSFTQLSKGKSYRFQIPYTEHWDNNKTVASILWGGYSKKENLEHVDIFNKFMEFDQMLVSFVDSLGLQKVAVPLYLFQKKYKTMLPLDSLKELSCDLLSKEDMNGDNNVSKDEHFTYKMEMSLTGKVSIKDTLLLKEFIKHLRFLVNSNNKEELAGLLIYPQKSLSVSCRDTADFIRNYDKIFDNKLVAAINNQNLNRLFYHLGGVLVGCNLINIWIESRNGRYIISQINNSDR